jgi:hypothetical protein
MLYNRIQRKRKEPTANEIIRHTTKGQVSIQSFFSRYSVIPIDELTIDGKIVKNKAECKLDRNEARLE